MYRASNIGFFLSLLTVKMLPRILSQQETYGEPFMYLQQYKHKVGQSINDACYVPISSRPNVVLMRRPKMHNFRR